MTRVAILAALLAGGCSAMPPKQVNVPVPVECRVQTPARPSMPTERLAPGVDVDPFLAAALAEIELREGYEGGLREALAVCVGAKSRLSDQSLYKAAS